MYLQMMCAVMESIQLQAHRWREAGEELNKLLLQKAGGLEIPKHKAEQDKSRTRLAWEWKSTHYD